MKRRRKTRVVITALTAVVLLSTSAWAIASKAEELGISKTYLSSKVTSIPVVTKETILSSTVIKQTSSNSSVTDKTLIAKGKAYTIAIEKAKQEEIARKVEATRLAKIAADKAKKAEVDRLAKIAADKVKKAELLAKQAQDAKVAQAAAEKAKQEEINRIAAERADKSKQAQIAENYRIAKVVSDRTEQTKIAKLAKVESDRLAKVERDRLAKVELDRIAKVESDRIAKAEADRLAVIEVDRIEADRLENADLATLTTEELAKRDANRIAKVESDRLAKIESERLAKIETDRRAREEAARLANIESVKLAKIQADRLAVASGLKQTAIGARLATYLTPAANVGSVLNRAVELHGGDFANNCVYFSSEAMRRIGESVPSWTCNTRQYLSYLRSHGWVSNYDISKLTRGSICFTTSSGAGYPTHTFAFMGWVNSGNYTLAYVADNQGNTVHVRNMGATVATDAFAYFMHN